MASIGQEPAEGYDAGEMMKAPALKTAREVRFVVEDPSILCRFT